MALEPLVVTMSRPNKSLISIRIASLTLRQDCMSMFVFSRGFQKKKLDDKDSRNS